MFSFSTKAKERLSHKAKITLLLLYIMSVHKPGEIQQQMMLDSVQPDSKTVSAPDYSLQKLNKGYGRKTM